MSVPKSWREPAEPVSLTAPMPLAISLQQVCKAYKIYDKSFSFLREVLTGRPCHNEKPVLHDISLDIRRGEVVGIIGRNGAGKSTLLKLIAGTLAPSSGKISVNGRVSAILELGTGFNPAYSGRDNVIVSALMRGMPETEVRRKFDAIVAFSGLEDVIDQPFHTYSSGMQARLAFAAAVSVEADVIIIDEALAAGDIRFAARSLSRIREICASGVTALFVSHTTYQVMQLCTRAIWIDDGRVRMDGSPIEVVRAYEYEMHRQIAQDQGRLASGNVAAGTAGVPTEIAPVNSADATAEAGVSRPPTTAKASPPIPAINNPALPGAANPATPIETSAKVWRFSTSQYRILDVAFLDRDERPARAFRFGDRLIMRVAYECSASEFADHWCGLAVIFNRTSDVEPVMFFSTNHPNGGTALCGHVNAPTRQHMVRRGLIEAVVDPIQLKAGEYSVSVAVLPKQLGMHEAYEYAQCRQRVMVLPNGFDEPAVFYPIVTWRNGPIHDAATPLLPQRRDDPAVDYVRVSS